MSASGRSRPQAGRREEEQKEDPVVEPAARRGHPLSPEKRPQVDLPGRARQPIESHERASSPDRHPRPPQVPCPQSDAQPNTAPHAHATCAQPTALTSRHGTDPDTAHAHHRTRDCGTVALTRTHDRRLLSRKAAKTDTFNYATTASTSQTSTPPIRAHPPPPRANATRCHGGQGVATCSAPGSATPGLW